MKRYVLPGVFFIAVFLRLYALATVPPSPSLDEVSIGYNAHSILSTGKDEYGNMFPTLLRAYDDYRPALYVYLTIPFVAVLGLTAMAVRIPSVILSILTVAAAYGIGKMIGKKYFSFSGLGYITAFLLSISPWHIYISRLGHEANLGLALVSLGVYFLLSAAIEGKIFSWILSAIFMGLSVHGYQSEKIVSPLLMVSGFVLFWKEVLRAKREVLFSCVIGILIAFPALLATVSPEGMVRFRGTSAFSPDAPIIAKSTGRYIDAQRKNDRMGMMLNSKYVAYATVFAQNYSSHFSPIWLFMGESREAHKVPGLGLLYLWEAPFLILGVWALMRSKISKKTALFIFLSLLIAPIPASVTTQAPHAMRSYTVIPLLQLVEAMGIWFVVMRIKPKKSQVFAAVLGGCAVLGLITFWNGYFVRFPKEQSDSFQYALAPAIRYALAKKKNYKRIEFSHQGSLYQSYMFFLFYSRFDPSTYLSSGGTTSGGYEASHAIGKYSFGFLPQRPEDLNDETLYFYDAKLLPNGARVIERFANMDDTEVIVAAVK